MYLRTKDLMQLLANSNSDACVFSPSSSGKYYARRVLIARVGPRPFAGAVCRHLCENDSHSERTCIKHTVWGTVSENVKDAIAAGRILFPTHLHTAEVRAKGAEGRRGKTQVNRGRPLSDAHRAALSTAAKRRRINKQMIAQAHAHDAAKEVAFPAPPIAFPICTEISAGDQET